MESGKPGRRLLGQVMSLRVSGACNTGLGGDWVQCALGGGGRRAEVMSRCDGVLWSILNSYVWRLTTRGLLISLGED